MRRATRLAVAGCMAVVSLGPFFVSVGRAHAALPGHNGLIAFESDRDHFGEANPFEIYVMHLDGSNQTRLTHSGGTEAAWSPDGTKIAFVRSNTDAGGSGIWVMNADGSDQTQLTTTTNADAFPTWSPDGSKIAFARYSDGNYDIWVMSADGTGAVNITNDPAEDIKPSWNPGGTQIAFQTNRDGNPQIYTMNSDGSDLVNVSNDPAATDQDPDWSPDGSKIVFESNRDTPSFGEDVYVMHADGSDVVRLTTTHQDGMPAWSPDGTKIVFGSYRDFDWEIYVMSAAGSGATRLTNDSVPATSLTDDYFPSVQPVPPAGPGTTPTLTEPVDGEHVGGSVVLSATTTAPNVQFLVDGVAVGGPATATNGTATVEWPTWGLANGSSHTVGAADCDETGCGDPAMLITVTVENDAPVLMSPAPGETVGASTTFTATADGGGVEFLVDGVPAGFDGTAPYALGVSGLAQGAHDASVQGCDATGDSCAGPTSEAIPFVVRVLHPSIKSVSPSPFSPNGDGRRDTTTVTYSVPDTETAVLRIVRPSDNATIRGPINLGTLTAGTRTYVWNGRTNSGARAADSFYSVKLDTYVRLAGSEIARGSSTRDVVVDDTPPDVSGVIGAGVTFNPYPDGYRDTFTPGVHLTGAPATLYLDIRNANGSLIRRMSDVHTTPGTFGITWHGRYSNGAIVPAGRYTFRYWAQDPAGNQRFTGWYNVFVSSKRLVNR